MKVAPAALIFIAACAPPKDAGECTIDFTNQGTVRVLSIGHHVELDDARDLETFEASFRRHLPMIRACSAGDRPTLVVFPEDSGLVAWFLGTAGLYARGAGDTETAFNLLYATMWRQADAYRAKFPGISSARALTLALSDHAWRAMERTFSNIAKDANVWVVTSANLPPMRESNDVADSVFLDSESTPPAYVATSAELFNVGLVYSPEGVRVHETRKVFLTDTEEQTLDLSNGSLEDLRTADLPFGKIGIAISRDAFYPPFNQRLDDLGAELIIQPEAFSGWSQEEEPGDWLPEVILASSWGTTHKYASTRFSAMPVLTGNVLSVIFDGQPWVTSQSTKTGALVGMPALPGFESIGAWTYDDDQQGSLDDRRTKLRALGASLLPGGSSAGKTVDSIAGADLAMVNDGQFEETPTDDTASIEVAPSAIGHQRNPSVAVAPDGSLHVAWSDTRSGIEQIMTAHSIDGGWSEAEVVLAGERQLNPSLAIHFPEGTVALAWQELRGDLEQIRWADGTWVEASTHAQWHPAVTFASDAPLIAWTDFRDGPAPFIRVKCDAQPSQRVDASAQSLPRVNASQAQPTMVRDRLAWLDYRDRSWHVRGLRACLSEESMQLSASSDHEVLAADPRFFISDLGKPTVIWDEIRDRRGRRQVANTEATDEQRVRPTNRGVFQGEKRIATAEKTLINGAVFQPLVVGNWLVFTDARSGFRRIRVLAF